MSDLRFELWLLVGKDGPVRQHLWSQGHLYSFGNHYFKKIKNNKNTNLGELVLTSHTSRDKNALLLSFRTVIDSCQSDNKLRGNIVVYLTP